MEITFFGVSCRGMGMFRYLNTFIKYFFFIAGLQNHHGGNKPHEYPQSSGCADRVDPVQAALFAILTAVFFLHFQRSSVENYP